MIDTKELRRLAEDSQKPQGNMTASVDWVIKSLKANEDFRKAANPSAILSLLDKIDGLVWALQTAKHVVANDGTKEQLEEVFAALESVGVKP